MDLQIAGDLPEWQRIPDGVRFLLGEHQRRTTLQYYTKAQLKAAGLPASLVSGAMSATTRTRGRHSASGARIYENLYTAWSIVYLLRDQPRLDHFLALCAKRGFNFDAIPGLEEALRKQAQGCALKYGGVQYHFPEPITLD